MKKFLHILYPVLIFSIIPILYFLKESHAGSIRKIEVSQVRSGVVRLAVGRTTVISFLSRPEKVVPGSPQALEVNFLGKDITVRPLSTRPGNLIVYTKSGRFVVLLQMGSDSNYDDVVEVVPVMSKHGVNLLKDTYVRGSK